MSIAEKQEQQQEKEVEEAEKGSTPQQEPTTGGHSLLSVRHQQHAFDSLPASNNLSATRVPILQYLYTMDVVLAMKAIDVECPKPTGYVPVIRSKS